MCVHVEVQPLPFLMLEGVGAGGVGAGGVVGATIVQKTCGQIKLVNVNLTKNSTWAFLIFAQCLLNRVGTRFGFITMVLRLKNLPGADLPATTSSR